MHIQTLKIFCDLVERRSFSRTAEKHDLSQSAISQQIAQIELANKAQLIDRKKRPFELTDAGKLFYDAARDIVARYEQFKNELNTMQKSSLARINIGAIYSIGMHTLPYFLKRFMAVYSDVHVHVEYLASSQIYERILTGEIDIGLVAVPQKNKDLEMYDFQKEPLVFVCSRSHVLAQKKQLDIHQIQFERFIGFEKTVPTRRWLDSILHHYSISIQPIMEFDNIETVKRAIEINSGISLLPETALLPELATGLLKAIPLINEEFYRPTGIIVRKNKILGKAGRHLIDLLRSAQYE